MPRRSLRERVIYRLRHLLLDVVLRFRGKSVRCSVCGRVLFRALPVVYRGRLRMLGASEINVRVAFSGKETLEFRHLELDSCPAPERPWVH